MRLMRVVKGTVPVPEYAKPILLVGRENMNRAVQGDVVAVEVFPESEWKAPADEVVDQEGKSCDILFPLITCRVLMLSVCPATLKNDDAEDSEEEGDDDEALAERKLLQKEGAKKLAAERQPTGRVVGIIKRN